MTDVKCPMCSKSNPAESQVCQYCGARIVPLGSAPLTPPADDTPDWLRDLRGGESQPAETTASDEGEVPDWLARIRGRSQTEESAQPAESSPDWLADLAGEAQPAAAGGDEADWLNSLRADQPAATPESESAPAAEAGEMPDWLSNLAPAAGTVQANTAEPAATEEDAWMQELQSWQPTQAQEPAAQPPVEPASDWLSETQSQQPSTSASPEDADWLKELESWTPEKAPSPAEEAEIPAAAPAAAGETPDWLAGLQPPEETEIPAAAPAGETPDWLAGLPTPEETQIPAAAPAGETPDWLAGLQTPEEIETPAVTPAEEVPDWLTGLPKDVPVQTSPSGAPDWLSGLEGKEANETPASAAFGEEVPDWLSTTPAEEPEAMPVDFEGQVPAWMTQMPGESEPAEPKEAAGGTPDWLKAFGEPEKPPEETFAPSAAFPAEDVAEWLAPAGAETSGTSSPFVGAAGLGEGWEESEIGEAQKITPAFSFDLPPDSQTPETEETLFGSAELPQWLPTSSEESRAVAPAALEGIPDGLAPAELPNWVAAMRPVESAAPLPIPQPDDQQVERLGPLAGLRGALPGQETVIQYAKPPIYSVKLQVSDRQRLHSNLLEGMLSEEAQPRKIEHELVNRSARWFRLITAFILIAAILIPLIFGGANPVPAGIFAPGTPAEKLYNQVNVVGSGPVLVIVDYEPGLAGEMKIAARGVVQHLLEKSTFVALVSSNATGPLLAEQLLLDAFGGSGTSANLGYVPGGATGLQALVSDLRGTLRQPLRGGWNTPELQAVNQLADFKQVILVTGSDESARVWIEQVQPALGATPLLVISSAQAAPMLQPYVDSGQINTLLSGLMGGTAYQQLHQSTNPGNGYWLAYFNAYQTGFAVAIAMIVLGLLLQIFLAILNQTKKRKGA